MKKSVCFDNIRAEREDCELHKLECLQTERNTDDGNATNNSRKEITDCQFPTEKNEPNHVHDGMLFKLHSDILAKRSEVHRCEFEALDAERDTDNGDTKQKSEQEPSESKPDTAENEPNEIADQFHIVPPVS